MERDLTDARARIELFSETAQVAEARAFVRRVLSAESASTVADAALVVSELVTNAIEHGDEGRIDVEVGDLGGHVVVAVTSPGWAAGVGGPETWQLVEAGAVTGRGLALVSALAERVHVERADARTTTSVHLAR